MHYDGPTYRPPTEQYTPLLQVTVGCSYNKCAFCSMYKKVDFRMSPQISCFFFGSHPYNLVPVSGYMSQKEEMIAALKEGIKEYEDEFLDSVWYRGGI